jgi:hypothetical protein
VQIPVSELRAAWSNLAPVDVRHLIATGVPPDAITDGSLDVERLLVDGWTVTTSQVTPPGVE